MNRISTEIRNNSAVFAAFCFCLTYVCLQMILDPQFLGLLFINLYYYSITHTYRNSWSRDFY